MRARLAAAAFLAPAVALAAAPGARTAAAATAQPIPFDAYIADGDASCLELNVNIAGYSFTVEPDVRMPRASSTISEGESAALAAPIDPGDSVDTLGGLLVPREEGQVASGLDSASANIPIPIPGDPGSSVVQALNPINPALEYPIEHASATYPQPGSTAAQESTYLGASNVAAADPTGLLSLDGTAGNAKADAQSATADAGAGAALSVSLLGLSVGRFSAHSASQVGQSTVSDDVSCTLGNVDLRPPGTGYSLHIGSLTATLHSERSNKGHKATSTPSLEISGMSVTQTSGGTTTTSNLSPAGNTVTVPASLSSVALPQPPNLLPLPAPVPASIESLGLTGTTSGSALSSQNNEVTSSMIAATLTMRTTAPVPTSIPTGPPACLTNPQQIAQCLPSLVPAGGGLPITSAPATYTLSLASLDSRAYGFISSSASTGFSVPGGGATSSPLGSPGSSGSAATGTGRPGTPGTKPVSATLTVAGTAATIRWTVVALAGLLEALLLAALFMRRRSAARGGGTPPSPDRYVDMP
ncbi:MAG: hypothetical protein JOZ75_08585 [Candidatus Dormibacteraeota bacterium]|nr:hypothetical protein [Candidatus Dormibacteraeota bacterium]